MTIPGITTKISRRIQRILAILSLPNNPPQHVLTYLKQQLKQHNDTETQHILMILPIFYNL